MQIDRPSSNPDNTPLIKPEISLPEITVKAVILAIIITAILGASNVYLALKLGNTIAASIPAAVLAMGVLRFFKKSNVLENNIVQTAASAGEGVAAAISFVLPALIIMGYWHHFHYLATVCLTLVGGILGVMFSIPLRRVMLNYPTLRFPEGTAIGNVLKASAAGTAKMADLIKGGLTGAIVTFTQTGFKVFSDSWQLWTNVNKSIFGVGLGFSSALVAAGYIVGFQVGASLLVGLIIGWFFGMPILTHHYGIPTADSAYDAAMIIWSKHIRFIGVGTMIVGGAWTLLTLLNPIYKGVRASFKSLSTASRNKQLGVTTLRTERDIPIHYVGWIVLVIAVIGFFMFLQFLGNEGFDMPNSLRYGLSAFSIVYVLVGGFFIASICAYLSGLIGMTNNPLSGLLLVSVLIVSLVMLVLLKKYINVDPAAMKSALSIIIIITTVVGTVISISGENLQDLKAGQMVGATPWKQQVMLILGVAVASLVVGPVLELLFQAYGMGGVFPRPGMDPSQMLAAPQAGLMTAVAQGVLGNGLPWSEIIAGMLIAAVAVFVDENLKRKNLRLPVLAMGLGIYLPPEIITPVIFGSFVSFLAKKALQKRSGKTSSEIEVMRRSSERALLIACGIVAGSALMGVLLAIPFVIKGSSDALRIVPLGFTPIANVLGLLVIVAICVWLYRTTCKKVIV